MHITPRNHPWKGKAYGSMFVMGKLNYGTLEIEDWKAKHGKALDGIDIKKDYQILKRGDREILSFLVYFILRHFFTNIPFHQLERSKVVLYIKKRIKWNCTECIVNKLCIKDQPPLDCYPTVVMCVGRKKKNHINHS